MIYSVIFVVMCVGGIGGFPYVEIANGRDSKSGEAPYAVSIRVNNCHRCGGSIISERWILTTAYCIKLDQDYTVLFGTIEQYYCKAAPDNTKHISEKVINPYFYENFGELNYDVALGKVDTPFVFNDNVKKILLPDNEEVLPSGKSTIAVWGLKNSSNSLEVADILQVLEIEVNSNVALLDEFIYIDSEENEDIMGKICLNDDGGSFVINNIQYGIIPSLNYLDKDEDDSPENNSDDISDNGPDRHLKHKQVAGLDVNSNHEADKDTDVNSKHDSDEYQYDNSINDSDESDEDSSKNYECICLKPRYFISVKIYVKWINEIINK